MIIFRLKELSVGLYNGTGSVSNLNLDFSSLNQGWIFWYHHVFAELRKTEKNEKRSEICGKNESFFANFSVRKKWKMKDAKNDFFKFQTGKTKPMKKIEIEKMQKNFLRISHHQKIRIEIRNSTQIAFCGFFNFFQRSKMDSYWLLHRYRLFWKKWKIEKRKI